MHNHQRAMASDQSFWTLTSDAVTWAALVVQLVSDPLTWTFAPFLTEALHSASLDVFTPPMHLKLAPAAFTSMGKLARPFTDSLNAEELPEVTFPSSSRP